MKLFHDYFGIDYQLVCKTIKEKLRKPLYIIINKVDTKSETEVDRVENLIKNTFLEQHIELSGVLRFGDCGDRGYCC